MTQLERAQQRQTKQEQGIAQPAVADQQAVERGVQQGVGRRGAARHEEVHHPPVDQRDSRDEQQQRAQDTQHEGGRNSHVNRTPPGGVLQHGGPLLESTGWNRVEQQPQGHEHGGHGEHVAAGPGRARIANRETRWSYSRAWERGHRPHFASYPAYSPRWYTLPLYSWSTWMPTLDV